MEMPLDGVGGVSILAKARVFRAGVHFPAFSFERHAETEGFGKMAKRMQFSVFGLPHYTVWHLYEPSVDDIKHMEEMDKEKKEREAKEKEQAEKAKKVQAEFRDPSSQWAKDKAAIEEQTAKEAQEKIQGTIDHNKSKAKDKDQGEEKDKDEGKDKDTNKEKEKAKPKKESNAKAENLKTKQKRPKEEEEDEELEEDDK